MTKATLSSWRRSFSPAGNRPAEYPWPSHWRNEPDGTTRARRLGARLLPHGLEKIGERGALEQVAELGLVVAHQADAVNGDVVDRPALLPVVQTVVEIDLRPLRRDQLGLHGRLRPIHPLAQVTDVSRVHVDLARVLRHDQVGEEPGELALLRPRERLPAVAQREAGHLAEVEEALGYLPDLLSMLRAGCGLGLHRAVAGEDALDGGLDCLRRTRGRCQPGKGWQRRGALRAR